MLFSVNEFYFLTRILLTQIQLRNTKTTLTGDTYEQNHVSNCGCSYWTCWL